MTSQQLIPLAITAGVLAIVVLRNRRARPLNLKLMWIMPLLVGLGIGMGLAFTPHPAFGPWAFLSFAVALVLGIAAGWWRGRSVDIHRDPETGRLMAQASPLGLVLIVGLLIVRRGLDAYLQSNAGTWHLNAVAVTDAFMLFAVGLVIAQRLEMFLRGRAIMAQAGSPSPKPDL